MPWILPLFMLFLSNTLHPCVIYFNDETKTSIQDFVNFLLKKSMLTLSINIKTTIFIPDQRISKRESQYYCFGPSTQNITYVSVYFLSFSNTLAHYKHADHSFAMNFCLYNITFRFHVIMNISNLRTGMLKGILKL